MEQTIHTHLKQMVDILKNKVYTNIKQIEGNDVKVRSILNEPVSENRTSRLKKWLDCNQHLMEENKELVSLQLSILAYLTKFEMDAQIDIVDVHDIFEMTVNRILPFDENHPLFSDERFKKQLLDYYTDIEDYETCARLVGC